MLACPCHFLCWNITLTCGGTWAGVSERWEEWDDITLVLTKRIIIFPTQSRDCFLSCEKVQIPLKILTCCPPDSRIPDSQMGIIKYLLILSHTLSVLLESVQYIKQLSTVNHTCNPSTQEDDRGGPSFRSCFGLHTVSSKPVWAMQTLL